MPERKETPQERYIRTHTIQLKLKLNKGTDSDVIEQLERVPNKSGYIKQLIRDDIARDKG